MFMILWCDPVGCLSIPGLQTSCLDLVSGTFPLASLVLVLENSAIECGEADGVCALDPVTSSSSPGHSFLSWESKT